MTMKVCSDLDRRQHRKLGIYSNADPNSNWKRPQWICARNWRCNSGFDLDRFEDLVCKYNLICFFQNSNVAGFYLLSTIQFFLIMCKHIDNLKASLWIFTFHLSDLLPVAVAFEIYCPLSRPLFHQVDGIYGGSPETYVRDLQWKTFLTVAMTMSGWAKYDKQPWAFGEPYTSYNRKWLQLKLWQNKNDYIYKMHFFLHDEINWDVLGSLGLCFNLVGSAFKVWSPKLCSQEGIFDTVLVFLGFSSIFDWRASCPCHGTGVSS